MAEIVLANGKGIALIDDEDAARLPMSGWYLHPCGYASRHTRLALKKYTSMLLHRLVIGAPNGSEVDHINHDKLDCRKANLRIVTKSQNMQNRKGADRRSRVGIRGVIAYQTRAHGVLYRASAQVLGQVFYRYGLKTPEDARLAAMELRATHQTHSEECR